MVTLQESYDFSLIKYYCSYTMSDGVFILCSFLLDNDVDFETLTLLTESQISTLVPSIGKQARILNAIKKVIFSLNKKNQTK